MFSSGSYRITLVATMNFNGSPITFIYGLALLIFGSIGPHLSSHHAAAAQSNTQHEFSVYHQATDSYPALFHPASPTHTLNVYPSVVIYRQGFYADQPRC